MHKIVPPFDLSFLGLRYTVKLNDFHYTLWYMGDNPYDVVLVNLYLPTGTWQIACSENIEKHREFKDCELSEEIVLTTLVEIGYGPALVYQRQQKIKNVL